MGRPIDLCLYIMKSRNYTDAETRLQLPAWADRGRENLNPPGISFFALIREDFQTHDSDILEQGFWALLIHRFGNWRAGLKYRILRAPCTIIYMVMYKLVEVFGGITLSYVVKVGRRVRIWHHSGIIVGARLIGNDVHIRQNTTIGVARTFVDDELPIIDDGVDIGCGASLLGAIYVAKNAKVGANTVVLVDVPESATIMGNPGQVLVKRQPKARTVGTSKASIRTASGPQVAASPRPALTTKPSKTLRPNHATAVAKPDSAYGSRQVQTAPMYDLGSLALLGSANLDYLLSNFRSAADKGGIKLGVYTPQFGRSRQELIDDSSNLHQFKPTSTLVVERAEDVLGDLYHNPLSLREEDIEPAIADRISSWVQMIELARQKLGGPIYVLELAILHRSTLGLAEASNPRGICSLVNAANSCAARKIADFPEIMWVPTGDLIAEVGRTRSQPGKYWHLGRVPYSHEFGEHLSRRLLSMILAQTGKSTRLIILDLDNTLWGGVLGEDGIENLKIGTSYPGSGFQEFQRTLKALSQRGIALAVASKNDEKPALEMINSHPEMLIREKDLAAHRINWREKTMNIVDMLAEVSLGAQSCLFLDDNPVERAKVRKNLPGIVVPDLPTDPADMASWLLELPSLECVALTESDLNRAEQYRSRSVINAAKQDFSNVEDFLRDLNMSIRFEPFSKHNQDRILQLLVKTNQFNATTRRHDEIALKQIMNTGGEVYGVGAQDRHSAYELMGVLILATPSADDVRIDSFLLSCRILGRTLETAILAFAAERAKSHSAKTLTGVVVETERNTPVRDVYSKHGFETVGPGIFTLRLEESPRVPDYFTIET